MTGKQAAQLGIDSRTYNPKKDMVEAIINILTKSDPETQRCGACVYCLPLVRKDLQTYINSL